MIRIVIVGAGVAGGVIARGLAARPDVELTVIEQVAPHDHASAGNGLNIGPNALKALDAVLPDVAAELRAASLPWTRWRGWLTDGTEIFHVPLAEVADRPGIRIRWSELYRIAREAVAAQSLYEHRCVAVACTDGAARASVTIERDGIARMIDDVDLVIVGDGRYSGIRERLCGRPPIRQLGCANFRTLVEDGGAIDLDDMSEWYNGANRLLTYRLIDGRIYAAGNFPLAPDADIMPAQKTADWIRRCYLSRKPVVRACAQLIEAACGQLDALHWARSQEIPTRFCDASGRVLFVGDSAHAMVPTLGQGATQALEDGCAFLALIATRPPGMPIDVPALTQDYARRRSDRIAFVKQFSWDASRPLLTGSDPVETTRDRASPEYRAKLRRLYTDIGIAGGA